MLNILYLNPLLALMFHRVVIVRASTFRNKHVECEINPCFNASAVWWYWKLTHRPFTFECFINKAIKIEPCPISYIRSRVGWRPDLSWGTGDEHVLLTWWENREGRGTTEGIYVTCMNEWPSLCLIIITAQGPSTASAHVSFSGFYSLYIQWCSETYKRNHLGWILMGHSDIIHLQSMRDAQERYTHQV